MRSFDYTAVIYNGDIYCIDHLPDGINPESDDIQPIFAGSEWDYVPVCCVCSEPIDYVQLIDPAIIDGEYDDNPGGFGYPITNLEP